MRRGSPARRQGGFTYMGVLFLLMLVGLSLAGTGEAWSLASRRARERELLWVGNQYARAIKAYYNATPAKQYPNALSDLVQDNRFPQPKHHLRQLYADPITRGEFAIVLSPDGRVGGVHSRSDDAPLKQANFRTRYDSFKGSTHYSDWHFLADDPASPLAPAPGAAAGPGAPGAFGTPAAPGTPGAFGAPSPAGGTPATGPGRQSPATRR